MKNMNFKHKLPVPKDIKAQYPLTEKLAEIKAQRDAAIADIFTGKSDKMVLIIGPCSADREDAVLDYCTRHNLPLVLCTTGQTDDERAAIAEAAKKIPLFFAAN